MPDRISWRINNIHPGGAEVTQQQEAVPPPSTALPDLRLARQISVFGIVRLAILGATSIGSKGSWSRHIDIVRMLVPFWPFNCHILSRLGDPNKVALVAVGVANSLIGREPILPISIGAKSVYRDTRVFRVLYVIEEGIVESTRRLYMMRLRTSAVSAKKSKGSGAKDQYNRFA